MTIVNKYKTRSIRFLEIHEHNNWKIKIYSISNCNEFVSKEIVGIAKTNLGKWLENSFNYPLNTCKIATLILHEGKEGYFALINWWIDENMIQNHVYLLQKDGKKRFVNYSKKGIMACVWELEVIWFERNNWVQHVLKKAPIPDFNSYLQQHLNKD